MRIGRIMGVVALVACGGQTADKVRPKEFTAQNALGGSVDVCKDGPKEAQPFVLDLPDTARADLEVAMRKKPVIVAYDCATLRVLSDCDAEGGAYEYEPLSKREKVIELKGEDELKVNLPMSAGKLSGEVKAGRSINLGLVVIGRQSSIVRSVEQSALKGECKGATHFLRRASVGAFTVSTGTAGKAVAIGELFSAGGSASSSSSRSATQQEGSLETCRSEAEASPPPKQCATPINVELVPIKAVEKAASAGNDEKKNDKKDEVTADPEKNTCPAGYVRASTGICTKTKELAHLCAEDDVVECRAQCAKGDAGSCYNAGRELSMREEKRNAKDEHVTYLKKACDLDHAEACYFLGVELRDTASKDELQALDEKSCKHGYAEACFSRAIQQVTKQDWAGELRYNRRACGLGKGVACSMAARDLAEGRGDVEKNLGAAVALYEKACLGSPEVCMEYAKELVAGEFLARDIKRAITVATRGCMEARGETQIGFHCEDAAWLLVDQKLYEDAYRLALRACPEDSASLWHCMPKAKLMEMGKGTAKNVTAARKMIKSYCGDGFFREKDKHAMCGGAKKLPAKAGKH